MSDTLSQPKRPTPAIESAAHEVIPGGAHTYAKGDDQYPSNAPSFIVRGKGCHVWDPEGNEFIEYGMGLRAVTLGHAYPEVVGAALAAMQNGANFTRPSPIEVECAEALLDLLPTADMVKFAKNGSDATTAAVKLARAFTGRDLVAICKDHPFFSVDDWFIGTTAMSAGIPKAVRDLTVSFSYDDASTLEAVFEAHPGQVACVVMEAAKYDEPAEGFLEAVRDLCTRHGALMVLDEMITGFRWEGCSAQVEYGIEPDLSTFGKGMGNGFSVAALAGRREIMELGGLRHSGERVFLLSTTHGAETHSLAAALETMRIYQREPVIETMTRQGDRLARGVRQAISAAGVDGLVDVIGRPTNLVFGTRDAEGEASQPFRTLFMQELVKGGIIAPSFVVAYTHTDEDIDQTVDVVADALKVYRKALDEGVEQYLEGPSVQPVFRRHN